MRQFRILVAYEERFLVYAHAFAGAIREARPRASVRIAWPRDLWDEVRAFGPHLVVSSQPADCLPSHCGAWYELSPDTAAASEIRVGGRRWCYTNPDLGVMRRVLDRVEGPAREEAGPARV